MNNTQTCTCSNCACVKKQQKKEKSQKQKNKLEWSKKLIADVRVLLWIVTIGALILAAFCIYRGYIGSLPWLSAMVGLPWSAHGVICSCYLNMAKSDHRVGGITYEKAKANNFGVAYIQNVTTDTSDNRNSPSI